VIVCDLLCIGEISEFEVMGWFWVVFYMMVFSDFECVLLVVVVDYVEVVGGGELVVW